MQTNQSARFSRHTDGSVLTKSNRDRRTRSWREILGTAVSGFAAIMIMGGCDIEQHETIMGTTLPFSGSTIQGEIEPVLTGEVEIGEAVSATEKQGQSN